MKRMLNSTRTCHLLSLTGMTAIFTPEGSLCQTVTIPIETACNALVLQADNNKDLKTIYLGKRLSAPHEYEQVPGFYHQAADPSGIFNSAYTPSGSRNLAEPAITCIAAVFRWVPAHRQLLTAAFFVKKKMWW